MITLRKSNERGHVDLGWLDTYHTFSFDQYYDPRFMNFRSLRVINEDRVAPARGFPTHGHSDMEIITYVLEGALEHKDSMGTGSVIRPGDVQKMSAGTGVRHSEQNPSKDTAVHLLQIWIIPDTMGIRPDYQQKRFEDDEKRGRLRLIVSPDGGEGSITIKQDAQVYASILAPSESVQHTLGPNRHAWIQVARGSMDINGQALEQGDGAAISEERSITLTGVDTAEILLFDLA